MSGTTARVASGRCQRATTRRPVETAAPWSTTPRSTTRNTAALTPSSVAFGPSLIGRSDVTDTDVQCARCGSSMGREDCHECGGDGHIFVDDFDFSNEETLATCGTCNGAG